MSTINIDFQRFHIENPNIYALFQKEVFRAIKAGRTRISARTVMEFIRWSIYVETTDEAGYKINNNHIPFYARMFMKDHPEHRSLFELRGAIVPPEPVQGNLFV